MISKTQINKRTKRKTNPYLVDTLFVLKKNKEWFPIAKIISGPSRKHISINLDEIDKQTKVGDTVVIPGKVLSYGNLDKRIRIVALDFSKKVLEKLKGKVDMATIIEEVNKNPTAKGIKIIR